MFPRRAAAAAHSNTSEREEKNFCFGQHAAIIFPRARIFRAITARDGGASPSVRRSERLPRSFVARSEYFKEDIFLQMSRGIFRFHGPYPLSGSATLSVKDMIFQEFDKRCSGSS